MPETTYVMTKKGFTFILLLLFSLIGRTQYFQTGQDPASIKWRQINTANFQLIYPVEFEAKAQKIKSEADGLSIVTSEAASAASKEFGTDRALVNRSVNFFGAKLLREQINRESVMEQATEELKNEPPTEDSKEEIDEDWLEMFSRIAETKSNKDVQLFLAKILAGEIRKPGSFPAKYKSHAAKEAVVVFP